MKIRLLVPLLVFPALVRPALAMSQWPADGVALCTAARFQEHPTIVSDGAGGAIVTWQDFRGGATYDIYAQRINASWVVQWTADGVALCTATRDQFFPTIVPDGVGGAIVTWDDYRSGPENDIYAQRINASGAVQWTADGIALCTASNDQLYPVSASDGAGGAIVTWQDRRGASDDIYAQRVDASGTVQWTADGIALCTASNDQYYPVSVSDGVGGAIVTWLDYRNGSEDIYAQRVDASGAVQWTANGIALCTATNDQFSPTIASDMAGGAIVSWQDLRGGASYDVYAQRINALGAVQWTADGVALSTAANAQSSPTIVSDGAGGAIVTWYDFRGGASDDIYAQRINTLGTVQWIANGVVLCTAANDQVLPAIASDGAGGAIVTWYDYRSGPDADIYAQRINASGAVQWTANGVTLCTEVEDQLHPTIISDGASGAIVTWEDYRSHVSDVYAQHVDVTGSVPTAVTGPTRGPSLAASEIHPNPFAGSASIEIDLTAPSTVRIEVFDVAGRRVRVMTVRDVVGSQRVEFDGRDTGGRLLPSGVYFYRVEAVGESLTRKMVIAR